MSEERDILTAEMFPAEWARLASSTGPQTRRQRHSLRRRAEIETQLSALRSHGASCASCRYLTGGQGGIKGPICDAHSDFHGYARTKPESLCTGWSGRRQPKDNQP